jgi:hypothetical protein
MRILSTPAMTTATTNSMIRRFPIPIRTSTARATIPKPTSTRVPELTPGPSFDESGFPDVSRLGARDVLITMWAQYLGTDPRKYGPGPPVSRGITLAGLTQDTPAFPAVEQRGASYLSPTIGYLVHVWSGKNADLSIPDAILRSFRPL